MRINTKEELNEILRKHVFWLLGDPDGERANLSGANLSGADLSEAILIEANLSGADLRWAILSEADLRRANLVEANLYKADLRGANLIEANLIEANLSGANLSGADLRRANLVEANLSEANLYKADLRGANLSRADLNGADLSEADLNGADLSGADLSGVKNLSLPITCPEEGSFIGFKKCRNNLIVKLEIPADALRCSATGRKCRCSKAKVLSITNVDGSDANTNTAASKRDENFIYKVGETVEVPNFNTDRWHECSAGIHFFITRQEAVEHSY